MATECSPSTVKAVRGNEMKVPFDVRPLRNGEAKLEVKCSLLIGNAHAQAPTHRLRLSPRPRSSSAIASGWPLGTRTTSRGAWGSFHSLGRSAPASAWTARQTPLSPAWRMVIRAEKARRSCPHVGGDAGALGVVHASERVSNHLPTLPRDGAAPCDRAA